MDIKEIIAALKYFSGAFPKAAVEAAIAEKDRIIPELLSILDYSIANIAAIRSEEGEFAEYFAYGYAMVLLSQFGEKRAFPLIARFFTAIEDDPYLFTGDLITEYLCRFLYSTYNGDLETLANIVRNPRAYDFVRTAALRVPVMLYLDGEIDKKTLVDLFGSFMACQAVKENGEVITETVYLASRACLRELAGTIYALYDADLVDDREWPLPKVEKDFSRPDERTTAYLRDNRHYGKITDTITEMENWDCFQGEAEAFSETALYDPEYEDAALRRLSARGETFTRTSPKIGRNDPCPCGSGKKYKKCCGG